MGARGSLVLEGGVIIFSVVLATVLGLELVRRSWYACVGHHSAFIAARKRALGATKASTQKSIEQLFARAFGPGFKPLHSDGLNFHDDRNGDGNLEVRLWHRFPLLLPFTLGKVRKHHFEQTRKCIFSLD